MSSKSKGKKYSKSDSDSDSDSDITFTKIKKIYKCGICDKKIKNYCKCVSNTGLPHSGSNIITIMTNPENENKQNIKGEKGDRGLTGSMGLPGNSFIFFATGNQINSGDFIGPSYSDKEFIKCAIVIPYDFFIKQVGVTIKSPTNSKVTGTLYVNNKPTDYVICVCDGITSSKSFNSVIKIKSTDLICFRVQFDLECLPNGISICLVINS